MPLEYEGSSPLPQLSHEHFQKNHYRELPARLGQVATANGGIPEAANGSAPAASAEAGSLAESKPVETQPNDSPH